MRVRCTRILARLVPVVSAETLNPTLTGCQLLVALLEGEQHSSLVLQTLSFTWTCSLRCDIVSWAGGKKP